MITVEDLIKEKDIVTVCLTCKKIVKWPYNEHRGSHDVVDVLACHECHAPLLGIRLDDEAQGVERLICLDCILEKVN
jgi:RNase P subunit RPR2